MAKQPKFSGSTDEYNIREKGQTSCNHCDATGFIKIGSRKEECGHCDGKGYLDEKDWKRMKQHGLKNESTSHRMKLLSLVPIRKGQRLQENYKIVGNWVTGFWSDEKSALHALRDYLKSNGVRARAEDWSPYEGHKILAVHKDDIKKAWQVIKKSENEDWIFAFKEIMTRKGNLDKNKTYPLGF